MKLQRFLKLKLALAVAVLVGSIVACSRFESILSAAGRWLNVSSPLRQPVDCVMVLGGGAGTRPFVAAEIVRAGMARNVLLPRFSESDEALDGIAVSESEMIRRVLLKSGVPEEVIIELHDFVDSTQSEAESLASYLHEYPNLGVAVVTNDYHTRRARRLFSRACGNDLQNLCLVGAPTDGFDASNWWRSEAGLVTYLNEFLKLLLAYAS